MERCMYSLIGKWPAQEINQTYSKYVVLHGREVTEDWRNTRQDHQSF